MKFETELSSNGSQDYSDYSELLEKDEMEISRILRNYLRKKVDSEVYEHILTVTEAAMRIADRLGLARESRKLVLAGALLHDVGRAISHGMDHAIEGAKMLRNDGFDERIVRIVERHIGAGLTAEEAKSFGLPAKDYIPETLEEKIVALADNLVSDRKILTKEEYLKTVKEKFSDQPDALERHIKLLKEFETVLE